MKNIIEGPQVPGKGFPCQQPGCNATYQRKEHLSRHETQHFGQRSFDCSFCGRHFGRSDTLRRHVRYSHKINEPFPRARKACINCRAVKARCEGGPPCSGCLRRQATCSLNQQVEMTRSDISLNRVNAASSMQPESPFQFHQEMSRSEKERQGLKLYFETFHTHWPFIHQGSFNAHCETRLLVQAMVVIGLWRSGNQGAQSIAVDLHNLLHTSILQQKEKWDASVTEDACSSCSWPLPTYQAILLHIIFSIMTTTSVQIGLDLKPAISSAGTDLLKPLILSCKKLGMLYYPNILARYEPDVLPSYAWICIEEVKRFNLALYRVWKTLGCSAELRKAFDTAGTAGQVLSAWDLQFPLPTNDPLWNAVSESEWLSAAADGTNTISLHDRMEEKWISRSASLLQAVEDLHDFTYRRQ